MSEKKTKPAFVEPMLLLRTEKLPEGPDWLYELKFDGYRALAIKTAGKVDLRSRNDNDFNPRYPRIVRALAAMPDETAIDGGLWHSTRMAGPRLTCSKITPLEPISTTSSSTS